MTNGQLTDLQIMRVLVLARVHHSALAAESAPRRRSASVCDATRCLLPGLGFAQSRHSAVRHDGLVANAELPLRAVMALLAMKRDYFGR
jgi:hypothetical protein